MNYCPDRIGFADFLQHNPSFATNPEKYENPFLVIKARLDLRMNGSLDEPAISDHFSIEYVVPDIDTGLDDDQGKADNLDGEPYCFIKCDSAKYVHYFPAPLETKYFLSQYS